MSAVSLPIVERRETVFRVYGGSPNRWGWWKGSQLLANGGMTPNCTEHPCYRYRDRFQGLLYAGIEKGGVA